MGNGERSGSGGRNDWRVRLATMLGFGADASAALLWRPSLEGLWAGPLGFGLVTGVGGVLGRLAGYLLFQRPPGR
jgi:hypothetical protein